MNKLKQIADGLLILASYTRIVPPTNISADHYTIFVWPVLEIIGDDAKKLIEFGWQKDERLGCWFFNY